MYEKNKKIYLFLLLGCPFRDLVHIPYAADFFVCPFLGFTFFETLFTHLSNFFLDGRLGFGMITLSFMSL